MNAAKLFVAFIKATQRVIARKWSFLVAFIVVMLVTVGVCSITGFIPDSISPNGQPEAGTQQVTLGTSPLVAVASDSGSAGNSVSAPDNGSINMSGDLPVSIKIPTANVNATIANPTTLNVDALDNYLLKGAARYPTSATLGEQGNMILFGHSSYLPIVSNKAYKTFDGIQNLKPGDQIYVYSATKEYVYSVQTVQKEDATSDGIALSNTGYTLTLATCDSFTKKTDRFVVTSTLVSTTALGN